MADFHDTPCDICGQTSWTIVVDDGTASVCSGGEIVENTQSLIKGMCNRCGFVHTLQSPLDESLDQYYEEVYSAKLQDDECDFINYQKGQTFAQVLNDFVLAHPFPPSGRLLDIGCGKGFFEEIFVGRYPQWQVEGVDPSARSIELARKRAPAAAFEERKFAGEHYGEDNYDLIAMHTILNRVSPRTFLAQATPLLKTGGILSIEVALLIQAPFELFFADHHYMYSYEHILAIAEEFNLELVNEDLEGQLSRFLFKKGESESTLMREALLRATPMIKDDVRHMVSAWQELVGQLKAYRDRNETLSFYGAGTTAAMLLAQVDIPKEQVVGVFDDNTHKIGGEMWGLPIQARSKEMEKADAVVLCAGPDGVGVMKKSIGTTTNVLHL